MQRPTKAISNMAESYERMKAISRYPDSNSIWVFGPDAKAILAYIPWLEDQVAQKEEEDAKTD